MRRVLAISILSLFLQIVPGGTYADVLVDDEEIVFRVELPGAASVYLVGDFNGWNPTIDKMLKLQDKFEIRLFLLPGKYSYRFIVDGRSIIDPDNPFVDERGNSFFILREIDGRLKLGFEESRVASAGHEQEMTVKTDLCGIFEGDDGEFFTKLSLNGVRDAQLSLDATLGLSVHMWKGESTRGEPGVVRSVGGYRLGKLNMVAFYRAGALTLDDPLGTFTEADGIFEYPLGVLSRGIIIEHGGLPFGISGKIFFADRFDDSPSGSSASPGIERCGQLFFSLDPEDTDMLGFRVSGGRGALRWDYLFKRKKTALVGGTAHGSVDGDCFNAYNLMGAQGFSVSVYGDGGSSIVVEYVRGSTRLEVYGCPMEGEPGCGDCSEEFDCKRGDRFLLSYNFEKEGLEVSVSMENTSIENEAGAFSLEDELDAVLVGFEMGCSGGQWTGSLETSIMNFSSRRGAGAYFLGRNNFWLDGDILDVGLVPFLSSGEIYRLGLSVSRGTDAAPVPFYPDVGDISLEYNRIGDLIQADRFRDEVILRKNVSFSPEVNFLLDLRYVSYNLGDAKEDFLDPYLAYYLGFGKRCWLTLGIGVSPYEFDRLLYEYTRHGRDRFLVDGGALDYLTDGGESDFTDGLLSAEEDMSEELGIRFEFVLSF